MKITKNNFHFYARRKVFEYILYGKIKGLYSFEAIKKEFGTPESLTRYCENNRIEDIEIEKISGYYIKCSLCNNEIRLFDKKYEIKRGDLICENCGKVGICGLKIEKNIQKSQRKKRRKTKSQSM